VREELKADWVGLVQAVDLSLIAQSSVGIPDLPRPLTTADRSAIELVLRTFHPTLVVTGPHRLPQARTNTRWTSSLAVPVYSGGEQPVGVVYATRNSTEQFTQDDLHWITAYASASGPIFF
jgi:dolichol-phosphate mannosyltransferase